MGIYIATLSLMVGFICYAGGWTCPTDWKAVYVRSGERVELNFQADISSADDIVSYKIWSSSGFSYLTVVYFNNELLTRSLNNCTLIGSGENGNLTISITMSEEAFVYRLEKFSSGISSTVRCITVYKLGIPSKPVVLKDRDPTVGESVTMTCSSVSGTSPRNHSLSLLYNWRLNDVDNPSDSRYAYSASRNTLTLASVVKEDANKRFVCSAFENIKDGYTSEYSDQITLAVLYGPENVRFNPRDTSYEKEENTSLPDIVCEADCYPVCTYTWAKVEGSITVSNTNSLQIGILSRTKAGTYRCIVARPKSLSATKDLIVKVLYAPKVSIKLSPSTIYQNQEVKMFCEATDGVPEAYTYTGFIQTYNGIIVQNDKLHVLGAPQNSSLHILSAQMRDTGTYTCYVSNGVKPIRELDQTASIDIHVKVLPTVLRTKLMFYGIPGKPVSISIPMYSYPDFHNFTILRYDGLKITNSEKYVVKYETSTIETTFYSTRVSLNGTSITLMTNNVSEIDFGKYLVSVFNEVGSSSSEIMFLAKGPPLPPTNFKISEYPGVLIFTWNNNVNGGDNQSFLIQTSQEGSSNWENQTLVKESDSQYLLSEGHHYANVSVLLDGVYQCRIIAFNSMGNAEAVYLEKSIQIRKPLIGEPAEVDAGNVALIVGIVLGILIIGLLVCVTLLIMKWRRLEKIKGPSKPITSEMERQMYSNVVYKEGSTEQDEAKGESSRRGVTINTPSRVDEQYSKLDNRLRDDSKAYDVISAQQ